jgi:hypothetical protein
MRVRWVKVWVDTLGSLTEKFRDEDGRVDFEALGREEYAFRRALLTEDYSHSERAREIAEAAEESYKLRAEIGRAGAIVRWGNKDEAQEQEEAEVEEAPKTPKKLPHGEFHNVMLTDEEMNSLRAKVYNADALVEELSQYLASSGRRYKNHYATLLNWCRRKEKEGEPKQKFLTTDEISRRNYEQSQQVLNRIMEERRHG